MIETISFLGCFSYLSHSLDPIKADLAQIRIGVFALPPSSQALFV